MSSNKVTEQQITSLIDELFEKLPAMTDDAQFFRVKTESGDAIQFSASNHTGFSYHIFELNHIARLCLQDYPTHTHPGFALTFLGLFINRLAHVTRLGIDNANDVSNLEAIEQLHLIETGLKKTDPNDAAFEARRRELLERIEITNKVMMHRHYDNSYADTSIPRLMGALVALRVEKPNEEITIPKIALHLGCEDAAVYKSIERYGISTKAFLNDDPTKWKPKRVDKLDRYLSKINSLPDDEK
jgi:hypothetical protein